MLPVKAFRSLYVSYFGIREPLVQRQVLPYLAELRKNLAGVSLLTFERAHPSNWPPSDLRAVTQSLARHRIHWTHLRYHKRPSLPATSFDIVAGGLMVARMARRDGIEVVHCRGHIPMAMGVLAKRLSRVRLVFDIRGFMPEEYVDAGVWPANGFLYRLTKRVEQRLFADADAFVVLTERARRHLFGEMRETDASRRPLAVIPCCVDLKDFVAPSPASVAHAKASLGVEGRRVYVYSGQLSGWYLDDVLVAFLARARALDPRTFAMILTPSPGEALARNLEQRGLDRTSFFVRAIRPEEMPRFLMAADVGLSFIKPCFSKLSSSPTKVGEYLAAGLPVISTAGIGDVDELLTNSQAGWLLKGCYDAAFDEARSGIEALLTDNDIRARLHAVARETLDLESVGATRYRRLYERLAATWNDA